MVEYLLAKQDVTSSSLVIRSIFYCGPVDELVESLDFQSRVCGFDFRRGRHFYWAVAHLVEPPADDWKVAGSIPASPTIFIFWLNC